MSPEVPQDEPEPAEVEVDERPAGRDALVVDGQPVREWATEVVQGWEREAEHDPPQDSAR